MSVLSRFIRPAHPLNLAMFRLALCAAWLSTVSLHSAVYAASNPREFLFPPGFWKRIIEYVPTSPDLARTAYGVFLIGMVMAALGLFTRVGWALVTIAGGYLITLPQLYGSMHHYNHVLWFSAILAVARSGDALSLDAWLARRRGRPAPRPSVEYAVPLKAVAVLLGIAYFFPAYWKIVEMGITWTGPATLTSILYDKWAEFGGFAAPFRIDHYPWVLRAGGVGTVLFEFTFLPLALAPPRWRWIAIIAGVGFHTFTYFFMAINFASLVLCYAALVQWRSNAPFENLEISKGRPPWAACVMCGFLIVGNLHNGLRRLSDWPLGVYPTFAVHPAKSRTTLVIHASFADGTSRVLTEPMLGAYSAEPRARGLCRHIMNSKPPAREQRFSLLWDRWVGLDPTLAGATRVRFVRTITSLNPDVPTVEQEETLWEMTPGS